MTNTLIDVTAVRNDYGTVNALSRSVSLRVPIGDTIDLMYNGAGARGYDSMLHMRLLGWLTALDQKTCAAAGSRLHPSLRTVRVTVDIAGKRTVEMLAADFNLTHTVSWSRRDTYTQRVYGPTTARVQLDYLHEGCERVREIDHNFDL